MVSTRNRDKSSIYNVGDRVEVSPRAYQSFFFLDIDMTGGSERGNGSNSKLIS